jgi:hypothetical protein
MWCQRRASASEYSSCRRRETAMLPSAALRVLSFVGGQGRPAAGASRRGAARFGELLTGNDERAMTGMRLMGYPFWGLQGLQECITQPEHSWALAWRRPATVGRVQRGEPDQGCAGMQTPRWRNLTSSSHCSRRYTHVPRLERSSVQHQNSDSAISTGRAARSPPRCSLAWALAKDV